MPAGSERQAINAVINARMRAGTLSSKMWGPEESTRLSANEGAMQWYAAYTSANHEKRVATQLGVRQVEHFLPTYLSMRQWKDRRVTLQLPLFPGYVFVRMALRDRFRVVQVPGVARLVGFNGTPAALPTEEIEALRTSLASGLCAEPHPYLTVGRPAQLIAGPLAGCKGLLVRRKGSTRVVLSIDLIQRSILVDVDASIVAPLLGCPGADIRPRNG